MSGGKLYLLILLTIQWLAMGPLGAVLSYFLFFSDAHGLPADNFAWSLVIFGLATVVYVIALRILLSGRGNS
ncbi:MAG: hypothetical protein AABZ73_00085 [Pseudomonadota bacterium]|uniref:hypothetical protein n=1 Tax=Sphingobium sp. TaxID=1912891 RepID=UPI002E1D8384